MGQICLTAVSCGSNVGLNHNQFNWKTGTPQVMNYEIKKLHEVKDCNYTSTSFTLKSSECAKQELAKVSEEELAPFNLQRKILEI